MLQCAPLSMCGVSLRMQRDHVTACDYVYVSVRLVPRSAVLIRSSVGEMSCSHRLNVDKEFRLVLSGSGPRFMDKEISTGTLAVRRVVYMFHDREFADVFASTPVAAKKQNHASSASFSVR